MSQTLSIADAQRGKQIAQHADEQAVASAFATASNFELIQRIGSMFSKSMLVPATFQGPNGLPDCVIAVNMANRIGADPLMVMQNLYVVHGKPAWSGQFVIAAINQSGRFVEPLHFEFVGTEGQDDWGCYASGITKSGALIKGPTVTIAMAKAEGWHSKNPKWRNMPELMLRYRAGAFFGKTECPELLMGFKTEDEVRDIIDIDSHGNVINTEKSVLTPAQAGGARIPANTEQLDADDIPWTEGDLSEAQAAEAKRTANELAEQKYYSKQIDDETAYFNAAGERWNPDDHATSSETGGPVMNANGSFRARRGTAGQQAEPEQQDEETRVGEREQSQDESAGTKPVYDLD